VIYFADYKDQLLAFGIIPGALGSEAHAHTDMKVDLDKEKAARGTAQVEADVFS
jgi:hypothetical protein